MEGLLLQLGIVSIPLHGLCPFIKGLCPLCLVLVVCLPLVDLWL